jgi:hypothetical protein
MAWVYTLAGELAQIPAALSFSAIHADIALMATASAAGSDSNGSDVSGGNIGASEKRVTCDVDVAACWFVV